MDDTTPKLRFVRLYLGKSKMDVALDDPLSEKPRLVKYNWKALEAKDVPPDIWHEAVLREVQHQRGLEHRRRTGRALPGE